MRARQSFVDGLGATIAFLLSIPYLNMLFIRMWNADGDFVSVATWILLAVGATLGVIGVLSSLLRPSNLWLYPVMFALATLVFGIAAFDKPIAAAFWLGVGVTTVGMGYGFGRLASVISRGARTAP
jgi:tetrahydromethanopterin S-methyltransferase subunit C